MNEGDIDLALEKNRELENIANELFSVDKKGVLLQGLASVVIAGTSTLIADIIGGVDPKIAFMIFFAVFIPNFGLKVIAEYIKRRALVKGLKKGYKKGRKDSLISEVDYTSLVKWARVYRMIESTTFSR